MKAIARRLPGMQKIGEGVGGFPYLRFLPFIGLLGFLTAMAFTPDQRLPLLFGLASLGALLVAYLLRRRWQSAAAAVMRR